MMQEEYEQMVGHDVDTKYYEWVEIVYMNHPAFGCPDDVRQFVRKKGGEDRMGELVTMAQNLYNDRKHVLAVSEYHAREAAEARAEAQEAARFKADDERSIIDLTRRAREAENIAAQAQQAAQAAQAEAAELRAKLEAIQALLQGAQ